MVMAAAGLVSGLGVIKAAVGEGLRDLVVGVVAGARGVGEGLVVASAVEGSRHYCWASDTGWRLQPGGQITNLQLGEKKPPFLGSGLPL